MTQGGNDPLTLLHRLSTASLSGVVRAFAYHRYFRFFLSLFFSTPLNEFFQIHAYLITDFDCWLFYFLGRTATARRLQTTMRACTASFFIFSNAFSIEVSAEIGTE